jgi:putative membrane protein
MGSRNRLDYLILVLKGMAMGAADVVPGVSGGTIAFISGIYEELISSINGISFALLTTLRKEGFRAFWKSLNGNFLLAVVSGIALSVASLARLISWLLETKPVLLWSFFFGLVLASIFLVAKAIGRWHPGTITMFVIGAITAWFITSLPPIENSAGLPFLFLSGALAICAMILPGISGAFILVLLGSYKTVLDAVHLRNLAILGTVALGALFGLLSFARLLKWMFAHFKNGTLALLTGFILGSLNKIWPWKRVLETRVYGEKVVPIREENISPFHYDGDPQLVYAILLAIVGFSIIFILEKQASKK